MRNIERIEPFCLYLSRIWKTYFPDWRFGQLVSNLEDFYVNEYGADPFYLEEDGFKDLLNRFVEVYIDKLAKN